MSRIIMASCSICRKSAVSGNAVSHAQNHTNRKFKPNLQKVYGVVLCTRCLKTIKKKSAEATSETTPEVIENAIEDAVEKTEEETK
jgi:ribosomal protein L28